LIFLLSIIVCSFLYMHYQRMFLFIATLCFFTTLLFRWYSLISPSSMFSSIGSNVIFNEIEYFTYLNLRLLCLFFFILSYFILLNSSSYYFSTIYFNHSWIEFFGTLLSPIFPIFIISPALIILLDYDISIIPSFIIYSLGYQWSRSFNIAFLSYIFGNLYTNIGFTAYCDHYIISSFFSNSISHFIPYLPIINDGSILNAGASINSFIITKTSLFKFSCSFHPYYFCDRLIHNYKLDFYFFPQSFPLRAAIVNDKLIITPSYTLNNDYLTSYPFYFSDISPYPIFPLLSGLKIFVFPFDVIHSSGSYSSGIIIINDFNGI